MAKPGLRAVQQGELPEVAVPKIRSVLEAAEHGSRLDELVQMRKVIARALDDPNTSPRDLAALSRRQMEISKEVEAIRLQAQEEDEEGAVPDDEAWSEEAI